MYLTSHLSIQRQPFCPTFHSVSPRDNLLSALAIFYKMTFAEVAGLAAARCLLAEDPATHPRVQEHGLSLHLEDLRGHTLEVLDVIEPADWSPATERRLEDLQQAVVDWPEAPRPAVVAGAIAMALEELMLELSWDASAHVELARLVAGFTDHATVAFDREHYTGFTADVTPVSVKTPAETFRGLVEIGAVSERDPRLSIQSRDIEEGLSNQDFLCGDLTSVVLSSILAGPLPEKLASDLPESPYSREALRRRKADLVRNSDKLDAVHTDAGRAYLRDVSRYLEGLGMNLSHGGHVRPARELFLASLGVLHTTASLERTAYWQRLGPDDPPYYNFADPAHVFLRDCRAAEPYGKP